VRPWGAARLAVALVLACGPPALAGTVRADDYDAFWLCGGVKPQPALDKARTVYMLQGVVEAPRGEDEAARLVAEGGAIPRLRPGEIWLDYRVHTLRWTSAIYTQMAARLRRWRAAGDAVVGVQIDFDAHTRHLDE